MVKLPWLALAAGLLLFGCAATAPVEELPPKETARVQTCATGSVAKIREGMAKSGVTPKGDLEGEPLDALVKFLTGKVQDISMPQRADRALLFEKGGVGLIVWFKADCAIGHTTGPWSAIKEVLGTPI